MVPIETVHLFYDIVRPEERFLLKELANLGLRVVAVNVEEFIVTIPPTGDYPSIGLVRTVSQYRAQVISSLLEELGALSINTAVAVGLGNNKALSMIKLSRAGLPVPATLLGFSGSSIIRKLNGTNYPLIVKPIQGSWGRLVSLVRSPEDLEALVRHRESMDPQYRIYLIQEYLEKPGRDIRVTVVDGNAVAAIYRYSPASEWRTNTARGGKVEAMRIDGDLEEISVKATEILGAHYAGVDIVESRDGYRILEVNTVPEFKNVMRVTGVNVARIVAEMVLRIARRG